MLVPQESEANRRRILAHISLLAPGYSSGPADSGESHKTEIKAIVPRPFLPLAPIQTHQLTSVREKTVAPTIQKTRKSEKAKPN
jgi:hypothetical protein